MYHHLSSCVLFLIAHLNAGLHSTSLSPIYKQNRENTMIEVGRERREGKEGKEEGGREGGRERGERKKEGGRERGERRKERGKKEGWRKRRRKEGDTRKEESYHHLLSSSGVVQGTPALEHVHQKFVLCQFYCVYGCDYQWGASLETFQEGRGKGGALGKGREGGRDLREGVRGRKREKREEEEERGEID